MGHDYPSRSLAGCARLLEQHWVAANALSKTGDALAAAEALSRRWKRRNPVPKERRRHYMVRLLTALDGERSPEWVAYEEALKAWQARYEMAQRESGETAATEWQEEVCEELSNAVARLANIRAITIGELRYKASIAALVQEWANCEKPITKSITDDLLHMEAA